MRMGQFRGCGLVWAMLAVATPALVHAVEVERIREGTPHEALMVVAFDGDRGLAGGAAGALMSTEDGGKTWKSETSPTPLSITAAALRGSRRLLAGQMGEIFFDDGSGTWQKAESGTKERLLGASINKDGIGLIVGSFGVFIRSEDGGKTWRQLEANWDPLFAVSPDLGEGFQPQLYSVQISDDGTALVVGEFETIIRSRDAGLTWSAANVGNVQGRERPPTLFAVNLSKDHRAYAVGQSGVVMSSADAGATWCRVKSGTDSNLFDVSSVENGGVVVSGMRKMLHASDALTWNVVEGADLSTSWYSGVAANGRGDVIAVGQNGNILKIKN